jgi:hypothetical protein
MKKKEVLLEINYDYDTELTDNEILEKLVLENQTQAFLYLPEFSMIIDNTVLSMSSLFQEKSWKEKGFSQDQIQSYKKFLELDDNEKKNYIKKRYKEINTKYNKKDNDKQKDDKKDNDKQKDDKKDNDKQKDDKKDIVYKNETVKNIKYLIGVDKFDYLGFFNTIELNNEFIAICYRNSDNNKFLKFHQSVSFKHKQDLYSCFNNDKFIIKCLLFINNIKIVIEIYIKKTPELTIPELSIKLYNKFKPESLLEHINEHLKLSIREITISSFDLQMYSGIKINKEILQKIKGVNILRGQYTNTNAINIEYNEKRLVISTFGDGSNITCKEVQDTKEGTDIIKKFVDLYTKSSPQDDTPIDYSKNRIKEFKKIGMTIPPRGCQKNNQPYLQTEANPYTNVGKESKMEWKHDDITYTLVCPQEKYKYPILKSFNRNEYICCYAREKHNNSAGILGINKLTAEEGRYLHINNSLKKYFPKDTYRVSVGDETISQFVSSVSYCFNEYIEDCFKNMKTYIGGNPGTFEILDYGRLQLLYTFAKFKSLLESNTDLHFTAFIDLLSLVYKVNIILLITSLDKDDTTGIVDKNTITNINCNMYFPKFKKYIIILHDITTKEKYFYPLIFKDKYILDTTDKDDNKIITNLLEYKSKCIPSLELHKKYKHKVLVKPKDFNGLKVNPKAKIVDGFNQVIFIQLENNLLVPIDYNSEYINLPTITLVDIEKNEENLGDLANCVALYKLLGITIQGVTLTKDKFVTSIVTGYGILVPIKKRKYIQNTDPPVMSYPYYKGIDQLFKEETKEIISSTHNFDNAMKKVTDILKNNDSLKKNLGKIVKSTEIPRHKKIQNVGKILENEIKIDKKYIDYVSQVIVNDPLMYFLSRSDKLIVRHTEYFVRSKDELENVLLLLNV